MIPSKYLVVVVQIVTIIVTSFIAALADDKLTDVEVYSIAGIGIGSVGVYFVPLLEGALASLAKFGVAVIGAVLAAIPPIVDTANGGPGWTATSILIVVLAGLNAALTAWGVKVRLDEVEAVLVDPKRSNAVVSATDAPAVKALSNVNAVEPIDGRGNPLPA